MRKNNFVVFFLLVYISTLFVLPLLSFVEEDRIKSTMENRSLMQYPLPSKKRLFSGEYFKYMSSYFSDQFFGRDSIMELYSNIQVTFLSKTTINDIVLAKDNFLLPYKQYEEIKSNHSSSGDKIIEALKDLNLSVKNYDGKLVYMYIPHKSSFYANKYPKNYENGIENYENAKTSKFNKIKNEGLTMIDSTNALIEADKKGEYIYFKTDHHHTFKGAYYSYIELINTLNTTYNQTFSFPSWNDMDVKRSDKMFVGSYLSKTGNIKNNRGDYFEYALPIDYPKFERFENGKIANPTILRTSSYKGRTINHEYILGNNGNTVIKTNRPNLPNILFIGYSYTNNLEALAVYNFNEMHSIDPRHWDGNISSYIMENKPEYVVVLRDDLFYGSKENKSTIK